jgi:mRNA-degrading endonuclease RelE of RelBE toxin-antitoxin system
MNPYRLLYAENVRKQIAHLHPEIKAVVRSRLRQLSIDPYLGKQLERDLEGYFSLRAKRFRIIYKIRHVESALEIHHVGHRRDVYEILREMGENS